MLFTIPLNITYVTVTDKEAFHENLRQEKHKTLAMQAEVEELEKSIHGKLIVVCSCLHMSLIVRKPVFGVFDQVRHKRGCTTTEDG